MAIYRAVQVSFWQDEFVIELTPEEKFFYVYLMTNPKTTQCGIFYQSKKLIEVETGYSRDTIDKLIDRFIAYGKVLYSNDTKEFMIVNWIKYNFINSKNTITCINKELKAVKEKSFVNKFYQQCKKYGYPLEPISQAMEGSDNYNSSVAELLALGYGGIPELQNEIELQNPKAMRYQEEGVATEENNISTTLGEVVDFFNNNIHLITPHEIEKLISWSEEVSCEVILMAAQEAVNHNARNMSYINGILCNWVTLDLITGKKLLDYKNQRENSKKLEKKVCISNAQAYEYVD